MEFLKGKPGKEKYFQAFFLGFFLFYIILLPFVIYNKGIFLYYGDFNCQQIPFYQLAHRAARAGELFWNWKTDLGANFIGSYAFYLLGSPFFWLTVPFPDGAEVYLIPVLLSLKYGTAALTAYAYARRFVRSKDAALIGGLLYAFSGFQAYNVFFNHFHDVTAFFPLLLIALEERMTNNRRGVFALAVGLMAVINYYFFFGEVIFVIIYFIIRCFSKDFKISFKKFLSVALEAVLGVMLAAFMLLPSILAIMGNPRVGERLWGYDMIVYNDKFRLLRIIQSFLMLPDVPARPNLFDSDSAKWSSIAGYLPLFSMAGVISFMREKKKHWASRLVIICMIFAFVPILNSAFSAFVSAYYARWFFMPILVMAMMTAYSVDNHKIDLKAGTIFCAVSVVVFAIIGCLPKMKDEKLVFFELPKYPAAFWGSIMISCACAIALFALVFYAKRDRNFVKTAFWMTVGGSFICTASIVGYGVSIGPYPDEFINEGIKGSENISLPDNPDDEFYRIDISENYDNYAMSWGFPCMRAFQSTVPVSIMEFYPTVDVERNVASRADTSKYGLRGLFSVKYYFNHKSETDETENKKEEFYMPGFEYYDTQNGFDIYENKYYIPMGFTFDYYIPIEKYEANSKTYNNRLLMKGIVLDSLQIERNKDILKPLPAEQYSQISEEDYLSDCQNRAKETCYSFKTDTYGFEAKINLSRENLVFFSVPYEKGFSAEIDGKPALIEKVDVGFMAVRVPKGEHTIRFNYFTPGLKAGLLLSLAGFLGLCAYIFIFRRQKPSKGTVYDYEPLDDLPVSKAYAKMLAFDIKNKKGEN